MTKKIPLPRPNSTKTQYWLQRGFLPAEANAFKDVTFDAINDSPYLKRMIRDRVKRYLRAGRDGLTSREYFFRIRKLYIDNGLATDTNILHRDSKGESQAFKLFNYYKDTYGAVDSSGKPIGTPRPKTKAVSKRGTSNDRAIRSTQSEIERLRGRLKFEKNDKIRASLQNQLTNQESRLQKLQTQFD